MLRTMAEPLGEVCSVTRRLLRRGLGLQTSRRVNVFFPAKGRILFEQASYLLHHVRPRGRLSHMSQLGVHRTNFRELYWGLL